MKKWTSQFCLSLMSISMLTSLPESAEASSWDPRCWNLCNIPFEARVEAISWKPCVDDLDYAAEVTTSDSETAVSYNEICPEWETGIRISVGLPGFCKDWSINSSYTYLQGSTSKKISFNNPSSTNGLTSPLAHPDLLPETLFSAIKGRYTFSYQEWDLLVKYNLCCSGRHEVNPFFGLVGVHLSQHLKGVFDNTSTVRWKSDYTAIGLRAGSIYSYSLEDCLKVFASAHGSLVVGHPHSKNKQHFTTHLTLKDDDCCHTMAGYHLAVGLEYDSCLCNQPYTLTAGYEFVNWYHVPNQRVFTSTDGETAEISHSTSPNTRTFGFHGVFAGIVLPF